jgi:hypothetical protein
MRSVNLLVIAFLVAFASAANVTIGTSCVGNSTMCSTANAAYCCANLVSVTWVKNVSSTASSVVCLNKTLISNGHVNGTASAVNTTATCIVSTQNAFLVKMSLAVASLGFLSLIF